MSQADVLAILADGKARTAHEIAKEMKRGKVYRPLGVMLRWGEVKTIANKGKTLYYDPEAVLRMNKERMTQRRRESLSKAKRNSKRDEYGRFMGDVPLKPPVFNRGPDGKFSKRVR
jgi:hypothetical protein